MAGQQERFNTAYELFAMYADIFNGEFRYIGSTREASQQSLSIATELLELGFIIRTQICPSVKIINPTEDTLQTVITITFNMALMQREKEMEGPLKIISATSHIFGPPTTSTKHEQIQSAISPRDEKWLRDILDSIKS